MPLETYSEFLERYEESHRDSVDFLEPSLHEPQPESFVGSVERQILVVGGCRPDLTWNAASGRRYFRPSWGMSHCEEWHFEQLGRMSVPEITAAAAGIFAAVSSCHWQHSANPWQEPDAHEAQRLVSLSWPAGFVPVGQPFGGGGFLVGEDSAVAVAAYAVAFACGYYSRPARVCLLLASPFLSLLTLAAAS